MVQLALADRSEGEAPPLPCRPLISAVLGRQWKICANTVSHIQDGCDPPPPWDTACPSYGRYSSGAYFDSVATCRCGPRCSVSAHFRWFAKSHWLYCDLVIVWPPLKLVGHLMAASTAPQTNRPGGCDLFHQSGLAVKGAARWALVECTL